MTRHSLAPALALLAGTVLLLAGCSTSTEQTPNQGPDAPGASQSPTQTLTPPQPQAFTEDGDMLPYEDILPTGTQSYTGHHVVEPVDENHLRVTYVGAPQVACDRVSATVEETDESITLTIVTGTVQHPEVFCDPSEEPETGFQQFSLLIQTQSPVGDRTIIDGTL